MYIESARMEGPDGSGRIGLGPSVPRHCPGPLSTRVGAVPQDPNRLQYLRSRKILDYLLPTAIRPEEAGPATILAGG